MITPSYSTYTINYVPKEIAEMRWQVLYPSSCISVTDKYNVLFFWSDPKTMSGQGRSWMNLTNESSICTASFAIKAQNVLGFRVPSLLLRFLYAVLFFTRVWGAPPAHHFFVSIWIFRLLLVCNYSLGFAFVFALP